MIEKGRRASFEGAKPGATETSSSSSVEPSSSSRRNGSPPRPENVDGSKFSTMPQASQRSTAGRRGGRGRRGAGAAGGLERDGDDRLPGHAAAQREGGVRPAAEETRWPRLLSRRNDPRLVRLPARRGIEPDRVERRLPTATDED